MTETNPKTQDINLEVDITDTQSKSTDDDKLSFLDTFLISYLNDVSFKYFLKTEKRLLAGALAHYLGQKIEIPDLDSDELSMKLFEALMLLLNTED